MAAALLARRLSDAGVTSEVSSAGTRAEGLAPATREAIAAVAERGLDISSHRSRPLAHRGIANAALVLGMAREHVREVVIRDPAAMPRSFTLKDLVRRGERSPHGQEPLAQWLVSLNTERGADDLLGASPEDDVRDPIGHPLSDYRATAAELDCLAERFVRLAWPH